MTFLVQGKTTLVTGAGSGICLAFAEHLLAKGCNVVFADLCLRPEAQAILEIYADKKTRARFIKTDVTIWEDLEKAVTTSIEEFGGIDIFCPGAGVFEPPFSNFWIPPGSSGSADTRTSNSYKTLDINLTHPIRLTQIAISHLLARKAAGRIILISSIAAQIPNPIEPLYAISKAGISALVRSLSALEPQFGIRVAGVAPGFVATPMLLENPDKLRYRDEQKDVLISPEEVAVAMMRLVEDAEMVGGTVLEVLQSMRKVTLLNDPGPDTSSTKGLKLSNMSSRLKEIIGLLTKGDWGRQQE